MNSISADSVKANPVKEAWLSRNENGNPRWRNEGVSYWPNLNNADYRNRVLETAEKVKTLLYLVIVREILLRMKFVILENLKVPRRPEYGMAEWVHNVAQAKFYYAAGDENALSPANTTRLS